MRALLVLLFAAAVQCRIAPLYHVTPNIPGQYNVVLEDGVTVSDFAANMKHGVVRNVLSGIVNAVVAEIDNSKLDKVRALGGVKYVEEDGLATVLDSRDVSDALWGLDRIDQTGNTLDNVCDITGDGTGTNIFIIDTGIRYTHNEFGSRASGFYDYEGGDGSDCHGHGTHCAGTAAGSTTGVAPNAKISSVRVMSCSGSGSYSNIIAGLNAVKDSTAPNKVASMSIGGGFSTLLNTAVANAHAAEVVVVVAAGNSNADACNYSPSSAADAITVGSSTSNDWRSSFSNYGACNDIFAPGSSIYSASHNSDSGYTTMSGTSMACPHVAGAAAVLFENGFAHDEIAGTMIEDATSDALTNVGTGSPNKLLFLD